MSSSIVQPEPPVEAEVCHNARFEAAVLPPSTSVVTAQGQLDAANAQQFADFALRHAGSALILDLVGVEFFGTASFSALHTLNVRCAGSGIKWILVPGAAVNRLLQICDPDAALPRFETIETALSALGGEARPLLQLVAEPG